MFGGGGGGGTACICQEPSEHLQLSQRRDGDTSITARVNAGAAERDVSVLVT